MQIRQNFDAIFDANEMDRFKDKKELVRPKSREYLSNIINDVQFSDRSEQQKKRDVNNWLARNASPDNRGRDRRSPSPARRRASPVRRVASPGKFRNLSPVK